MAKTHSMPSLARRKGLAVLSVPQERQVHGKLIN